MCKKMKKKSFLLVETVISFALAIMIISVCFALFLYMHKYQHKEEERLKNIYDTIAKKRSIKEVLSHIIIKKENSKQNFTPTITDNGDFTFRFEKSLFLIPTTNTKQTFLYGKFYIDTKTGKLIFHVSESIKSTSNEHIEFASPIWSNVESIKWKLGFTPNDLKTNNIQQELLDENNWIVNRWEESWKKPPSVIQAEIQEENHKEPIIVTCLVKEHVGPLKL